MNKQQLHKEFDENFPKTWGWSVITKERHREEEAESEVKSFYDSKIQEILKELVGEERIPDPDDPRYIDWANGYNSKCREIQKKIKELGYE